MKFTELDLDERLMRGIRDLGFTDCTDVQAETFKYTLNNRDVAVQSQTGTGKTAAFLISIFQLWLTEERYKGTRALVVAPTRELAVQIERDANDIGKYLPFKTACFYGGVGYAAQEKAVAEGVDLIIGTPGRLLDFNQSRKIDFREVGILVIDEADRLFDMGFYPDIRKIMRRARPREERVTMLYSATLSTNVRNISWQFMNSPAEIEITPEHVTVDKVDQVLYHVSKDEKFNLLLGVLEQSNPETALIFCNTKRATEIVAKKLQLNGYPCEFIMGDLPQKKRLKIIDSMKSGELRMLCATDVAARGLHVEDLDMVINYDIPEDPEAYVHRIGRTARAGKTGRAVSLACERFVYGLEPIQELIGQKIPVQNVSADMIVEDKSVGKHLHTTHYADRPGSRRGGRPSSGRSRTGSRSGATARPHAGGPPHSGRSSQSSGTTPAGRGPQSGGRTDSSGRPTTVGKSASGGSGRSSERSGGASAPKGREETRKREPARAASARKGGDRGASRHSSVEDRLAYYKEKYGEDFSEAGKSSAGSGRNGGQQRRRLDKGGAAGASQREKTPEQPATEKGDHQSSQKSKGQPAKKPGLFKRLFGGSS